MVEIPYIVLLRSLDSAIEMRTSSAYACQRDTEWAPMSMKVLVTGAGGRMAAVLRPALRARLAIYGVSANTRSWWRLGKEAERLGWAPVDDAERFAARLGIAPAPANATESGRDCRQGGMYVDTDYRGGYW